MADTDLNKQLEEAKATLETATTNAESKMAELQAAKDWKGMAALGRAIEQAENNVKVIEAKVNQATREAGWAELDAIREPVIQAIAEIGRKSPVVRLTAITGTVRIGEDGDPVVSLTATMPKLDLSEAEAAIASYIDGAAFLDRGHINMAISITGLDTKSPVSSFTPGVATMTVKEARDGTTARAGKVVYTFNGAELGSREFLEAVEASGHAIATDRKTGFETSLRGNGNGLSNLAKAVAKALNVPSKEVTA